MARLNSIANHCVQDGGKSKGTKSAFPVRKEDGSMGTDDSSGFSDLIPRLIRSRVYKKSQWGKAFDYAKQIQQIGGCDTKREEKTCRHLVIL